MDGQEGSQATLLLQVIVKEGSSLVIHWLCHVYITLRPRLLTSLRLFAFFPGQPSPKHVFSDQSTIFSIVLEIFSNMNSPTTTVGFLLALIIQGTMAAMGPAYSTGPVSSGNFIREATATLVLPNSPNPIVGNTVLWTGMGTDAGDLIQAIANNYPADTRCVDWTFVGVYSQKSYGTHCGLP